jgi:hypothetical protein
MWKWMTCGLLAAAALMTAVARTEAGDVETARKKIAELQHERETLEGEIPINLEYADKMDALGRQLEAEAKECLQADPPRFSSAVAFQSQAREAYAAARKGRSEAETAKRRIRAIDTEISAWQRRLNG